MTVKVKSPAEFYADWSLYNLLSERSRYEAIEASAVRCRRHVVEELERRRKAAKKGLHPWLDAHTLTHVRDRRFAEWFNQALRGLFLFGDGK